MIKINLQKLLEKNGIDEQEKAAEELGVHRHTIANILNGQTHGMTFEILDRICEYFKVGVGDVLEYVPIKSEK